MNEYDVIQGKVVGNNSLLLGNRVVSCWRNAMQASLAPQPLNLSPHMGKLVEVRGHLYGDLYEAHSEKAATDGKYRQITGKVIGSNVIEGHKGPVSCYMHGKEEAWFLPLNLREYMGQTITVTGELVGSSLYHAYVLEVPELPVSKDPEKEARSLNDLLRIREVNRNKIEAVNGNLGTALGFKWTNNQKTDHPCIIIFVPRKTAPELIPDEGKAPEILEGADGRWCLTDVVSGGKVSSLDEFDPLPPLSEQNETIIRELKSGRVGLIGGIQLAAYENGNREKPYVGTAGIAVKHKKTNRVGFLTNQHVADAPGRRIYHPWHDSFPMGTTAGTKEFEPDEEWYEGVIDEPDSYVRCDCGFVAVDDHLTHSVMPGLYAIGNTGPLLEIDPETMDIIGQRVIRIGRTRGIQRGTIAAYAYEYFDGYNSRYTDLLIIGEDGKAFAHGGDSGSIIATDDELHRPVGLLWGRWQERLRHGREQEIWSYAIDLGKALDRLNLTLL